jgi:hypothetical protein
MASYMAVRLTLTRKLLCIVVPALLSIALPAGAQAAPAPAFAGLEGGFAEFSQTNALTGTLSLASDRAYEGARSAHATYAGGTGNGYARGIWNVDWSDGDDVWYGGAYYLPVGFHESVQGQVDLLRWDNWESNPDSTDWGGVSIYGSDRRARLLRFGAGRDNDTLVGPFDLPEGRWFWLEVHQRLDDTGNAVSELYLDGTMVGSSARPNTYGRGIDRIRYGIVAIAAGSQAKPLEMWFDKATVGTQPAGGTAGTPPVASAPSERRAIPARAALSRRCSTDRRASRRGTLSIRAVATTCRTGSSVCRQVYRRAGKQGFAIVRKTRTCRTASQTCRTSRRVVRRKGTGTRRMVSRRCRPAS